MTENKMKKSNLGNALIYLYVVLPIVIFLIGWTKWYIAIPGTLIIGICWYRMMKDSPVLQLPEWDSKSLETIMFVVLIIMLWVYLSGIGKFVFQNTDHDCRNPIFEILVNYSWPATREMFSSTGTDVKGLIYYIGFWLPAAVVGKLFGMTAGYCFQAVWAVIGVFIFYLLISSVVQEIRIWPLVTFIFFSGIDIVGYYLVNGTLAGVTGTYQLEIWGTSQYSSFTTQLFWVFNQALPAWIILMLIYVQKKNRYIVLLMGCVLISSTLPFIGMLPFVVYFVFPRKYDGYKGKMWWKEWLTDTFSVENVIGGGIAGIVTAFYLFGNEAGQTFVPAMEGKDPRGFLFMYVLFIIIEAGCYFVAIYPYKKRNPLFYISFAWLCICPWIQVGYGSDFCMRASIPALVILYLLVIETLKASWKDKNWKVFVGLMVLLIIGSATPLHEINRTTNQTFIAYHDQQPVYIQGQMEDQIFDSYNFSGKVEDSFFFKYLAK